MLFACLKIDGADVVESDCLIRLEAKRPENRKGLREILQGLLPIGNIAVNFSDIAERVSFCCAPAVLTCQRQRPLLMVQCPGDVT